MKNLTYLLLTLCFISCKNTFKDANDLETKDLAFYTLFELMQGSFDSKTQAKADSTYYNVSLEMSRIWNDKGHYIYVEQALEGMKKPYRQRVYELERLTDSTIISHIYKIPNDSLWIGKWKTPEAFNSINPKDLAIREGCGVIIKQIDAKLFKGATSDTTCKSTLRGASIAQSYVEISEDKIISWDRGFDVDGKQVWGAEKGGYIFVKKK